MSNSRVKDGADSVCTVNVLSIELACLALFKSLGISAKVQEGLCGHLIYVFSGRISVYTVEELIVLAGNYCRITRAKLIVEIAFFVVIYRIVGDKQGGCDKSLGVLKHSLAAGKSAVGVACYTYARNVNKGERGQVFYTVVKAVCIVFIIPPAIRLNNLGVTVAVHTDGENNVTATRVFNVVEILHFAIVILAVANNDSRGFLVSGSRLGN